MKLSTKTSKGNIMNTAKTVLADIESIQKNFTSSYKRLKKDEALAYFSDNSSLHETARKLATEAIDRLYEGVVWEDDVTTSAIVSVLDAVITRYRIAHSS